MGATDPQQPDEDRVESITAALVYLMTHYVRTGCPRLALCVSRHMQALAGLHGVWASASGEDRKLH